MIYDTIAHEDVWNLFFKNADPEKYVVLIHYKNQQTLEFFESAKLKECIPTKYGDSSLIHAQNLLMKEALKDPDVYKMVILSNTCIPLKSFDYVYSKLTADNNGHFNECPQSQCFPRCESATRYIHRNDIYKSSQWFIANRRHAECYIQYAMNAGCFETHPEEHYYITVNKTYCREDTVCTSNTAETATTFTNWQGMNYRYPSFVGIKNYDSVSKEEMEYLVSAPCFFGRKFLPGCRVGGIRMSTFLSSLI